MKRNYSIGLAAGIALFLAVLSFGYRKEYEYLEETADVISKDETQTVQGTARKEQLFCLKVLNGYIAVYLEDGETIYEYTDIKVQELPIEMQQELKSGKYIEGLDKLYGFLENYSS